MAYEVNPIANSSPGASASLIKRPTDLSATRKVEREASKVTAGSSIDELCKSMEDLAVLKKVRLVSLGTLPRCSSPNL